MDYSFFDGLIDAVFVVKDDRSVVYCNEAAAKLCESSVKRLVKGKKIYEALELSDSSLYIMPNGEKGKDIATSYEEMKYKLKSGKEGKVQVAVQPFTEPSGDKRWVVMVRDVTLEEVLHAKYQLQLEEKEIYIIELHAARQKLEDYSKNLEVMVEERTQEINSANVMINAIMNSLGQGFLVFDREGNCSKFYTKACEDILESKPAGLKIWEVLRIKTYELTTFQMWMSGIFSEQLPFESMKELGPALFPHTQDRYIKLDYFPLRGENNKIVNLVVVATDKTIEYQAQLALEKEKKFAKMVVKMISSKKQFAQFLKSV
jgi:two-component system, chemotaxis family, sensor kinase CheA